MARKLRVEFPNAIHLISTRGKGKRPIFRGNRDYKVFLRNLEEACAKTDWKLHAYCLMPTRLYLVIQTPKCNLVAGMKWLMNCYAGSFNRRHHKSGNVVSGRYKSTFVDGRAGGYLKQVCDYVHLRPAHAGLLGPKQRLSAYPWSSLGAYLASPSERPSWLTVESLLRQHGIDRDSRSGRNALAQATEALRTSTTPADFRRVEWNWCLGTQAFRAELLARMKYRAQRRSAANQQASATSKANRIIREEMKRLGWREATLAQRRKGDPDKLRIALRLRRESTVTVAWIAQRLRMGVTAHLAALLWKA